MRKKPLLAVFLAALSAPALVVVLLGECALPEAAAGGAAPLVVRPIVTLTQSFTGELGVQVMMTPTFWDPSESPFEDNLGGNRQAVRTSFTGARITVEVQNTTDFGVVFDDTIWGGANFYGSPWTTRPSYWAVRRTTNGVPGAWTYGLRPTAGPGGWIVDANLQPASIYRYELEPTHFTDHVGATAISDRDVLDAMREPEIVGAPGYPPTETGAFQQITGFVTSSGARFRKIDDDRRPLRALILGDSNAQGAVMPEAASPQVNLAALNSTTATVALDARGHHATAARLILENYCAAQNRRLVLQNTSYGGHWLAQMPDDLRYLYCTIDIGEGPMSEWGLASNLIDRFDRRTGFTEYLGNQTYRSWGRAAPDGWTPEVVVVAMVTNDQDIASFVIGTGQFGTPNFDKFSGDVFRNDAVTTISAIHAFWPAAKILVVNNHLSDFTVLGIQTHTKVAEACGPAHLNLAATNWGRYADIRALVPPSVIPDDRFLATHLTATQHAAVATALQPLFDALMAL